MIFWTLHWINSQFFLNCENSTFLPSIFSNHDNGSFFHTSPSTAKNKIWSLSSYHLSLLFPSFPPRPTHLYCFRSEYDLSGVSRYRMAPGPLSPVAPITSSRAGIFSSELEEETSFEPGERARFRVINVFGPNCDEVAALVVVLL